MAIGDRNKKGKPTDKVIHYVTDVDAGPLCKTMRWEAGSKDKTEVDCRKCLKLLAQTGMNHAGFTIAPWVINSTKKFLHGKCASIGIAITDNKDRLIARVSHDLNELGVVEYATNAKLVRAAPELFATLKKLLSHYGSFAASKGTKVTVAIPIEDLAAASKAIESVNS